MNNRFNIGRRLLSVALCLVMLFCTFAQNRANAGSTSFDYEAEPLTLESGLKLEGINLSLYTDGSIGIILHFSGLNDFVAHRGHILISGKRFAFEETEVSGAYNVTWHFYPKDFFGTYTVSAYDLHEQIPLVNESAVNGEITFSIEDLIDSSYEATDDTNIKNILTSLRYYTHCAHNYFYTNQEPKQAVVDSVNLNQYAASQSGNLLGLAEYYGSSITLDEKISIQHYFEVTDLDILKTDDAQKNLKLTIDGESVGYSVSKQYIVFTISNISVWDLDHMYDLRIRYDAIGLDYHLKYSVLSYVNISDFLNSEESLISKLVRSLYWYYQAVEDYIEAVGEEGTMPPTEPKIPINLPESPYGKTPIKYVYPTISPDANVDGYVTYSMFGAKGDGVTDDYAAIVSAHDYANEHHLPVKADPGATYYISFMDPNKNGGMGAVIKTDTDWTGASFIIDDRCLTSIQNDSNDKVNLFTVASYQKAMEVSYRQNSDKTYVGYYVGKHAGEEWFNSISAGQTKLNTHFDTDVLLTVMDHNNTKFIRNGIDYSVKPCQESMIVHKDGTVDEASPITFDYPTITKYCAYPIDEDTLTVKGGTFTTVVKSSAKAKDPVKIIYRGIQVQRSNTVLDGITHYRIEGGDSYLASEYMGFIRVINCCNILIQNCNLSSHLSNSRPGTYDLYYEHAVSVHLENVREVTDIFDKNHFGIMGANWVKNISANNCYLNRFDVHRGTTDAAITNSVIGMAGIRLIGQGTALIENTTVFDEYFVRLREDYGSIWDGDLIIKDCTWYPGANSKGPVTLLQLIWAQNNGNTYFGQQASLPNVYVSNLDIKLEYVGWDDSTFNQTRQNGLVVFAVYDKGTKKEEWEKKLYRPTIPEIVKVENVTIYDVKSKPGNSMKISVTRKDNEFLFNDLQITGDTVINEK